MADHYVLPAVRPTLVHFRESWTPIAERLHHRTSNQPWYEELQRNRAGPVNSYTHPALYLRAGGAADLTFPASGGTLYAVIRANPDQETPARCGPAKQPTSYDLDHLPELTSVSIQWGVSHTARRLIERGRMTKAARYKFVAGYGQLANILNKGVYKNAIRLGVPPIAVRAPKPILTKNRNGGHDILLPEAQRHQTLHMPYLHVYGFQDYFITPPEGYDGPPVIRLDTREPVPVPDGYPSYAVPWGPDDLPVGRARKLVTPVCQKTGDYIGPALPDGFDRRVGQWTTERVPHNTLITT